MIKLSELKQARSAMDDCWYVDDLSCSEEDKAGIVATHNAADALIELAEAALALLAADLEDKEVTRMMSLTSSSDDYSAACTLAPRVEEKRRAAIARLDVALSKVQP